MSAYATLTNLTDAAPDIGRSTFDNASDFDTFMAGLPHLFESLGAAFSTLGDRASTELPLASPVSGHFLEIASACAALADLAGDGRQVFRTQHESELARIENPRPGEEFFDVSKQ